MGSSEPKLWLDVPDGDVRRALEAAVSAAGHELMLTPGPGVLRVSDAVPTPPDAVDVYVVAATALGARIAVGAIVAGVARAVVSVAQLDQLAGVVDAIRRDTTSAPRAVLRDARLIPDLAARDHQLLGCLAADIVQDNDLARRLEISPATARRAINDLCERLDRPSRLELRDLARALGYLGPLATHVAALAATRLDVTTLQTTGSGESTSGRVA